MKVTAISCSLLLAFSMSAQNKPTPKPMAKTAFEVHADRFADIQVLRYEIPGWEKLSVKQKTLCYYLYQAALSGRDIIYDQKYKHNLRIRKTLEIIYNTYKGDRKTENWKQFDIYIKRVWFSNGIHHHYASDKIIPGFSPAFFHELVRESDTKAMPNPLPGAPVEDFINFMTPLIFDPNMDGKTVNLDDGVDHIVNSANNFYQGVTEDEVTNYYREMGERADKKPFTYGWKPTLTPNQGKTENLSQIQVTTPEISNVLEVVEIPPVQETPASYGLNSKLVKVDGELVEKVWKKDGMYGAAIEKIIYWLRLATSVAENEQQRITLNKLIEYYETGDLRKWDEYNIEWVKDVESTVDVVNGFIEVYQDALGKRASFESVVSIKDFEATKRIKAIANQAQWFEDNSPLMPEHKKKVVAGIEGKVINVVVEAGDAAPSTPIGINLPNANWIRQLHGSKSVSLGNIVNSYNISAAKSPTVGEFGLNDETKQRAKLYGALAGELTTDMHEVIGHASGQINPGVGTPDVTLKNYQNTLEEARADLVALYYIYDNKLVELKVMPSLEVGKAEYESYLLNGLMLQLNRIEIGKNLEESHMRNRQLVSKWVFEKGAADKVVELIKKDGKTYVKINDYAKLRTLFGQLLKEIQRIKSEGDYNAGRALVETYGVKVDPAIHKEVKERFSKLNVAPYKGFIQPRLVPVEQNGKIVDVKVEYPKDFAQQMLEYSKNYSFLPLDN